MERHRTNRYNVVSGNVYALSGRHCGPHSSSIEQSILNWHDRLFAVPVAPSGVAAPPKGTLDLEKQSKLEYRYYSFLQPFLFLLIKRCLMPSTLIARLDVGVGKQSASPDTFT